MNLMLILGSVMVGLLAILAVVGIVVLAARAARGGKAEIARGAQRESVREVNAGLGRMSERLEALETVLRNEGGKG